MGTLFLVRHGQASFGADDYDVLSELGRRQSLRLGQYFRHRSVAFEAALSGTMNRQIQTLDGIREGMGAALESKAKSVGARLFLPGLNEYDSAAIIGAIHPQPLAKPDTPELYKHHFRLLRDGLAQWMAGAASPQGMPGYAEFAAGVASALDHVRSQYSGNVLLVSSGGPIATAVGQLLATGAETTIELNMGIRNSSVTEFAFSPKRHRLVTFNTLPHLDAPEYASWISYA